MIHPVTSCGSRIAQVSTKKSGGIFLKRQRFKMALDSLTSQLLYEFGQIYCTFAISNSFASAQSCFSTRVGKVSFSSSPGDGEKRILDSFVCLVRVDNLTTETQICPRDGLERSNPASGVKGMRVCHRSHCCYGWATAQKLDNLNYVFRLALFCLKFNFMSESQRIRLQKQVLPLSIWTASWWHHSLGPGHFVLTKQWWQDWATSSHLCVFCLFFLHFWAPWCRQFPSGGYASNQNSESSHVKDPDCSAWMWRTGSSPSHRPSSPSTPFANAFCGLLTRWINPNRI